MVVVHAVPPVLQVSRVLPLQRRSLAVQGASQSPAVQVPEQFWAKSQALPLLLQTWIWLPLQRRAFGVQVEGPAQAVPTQPKGHAVWVSA